MIRTASLICLAIVLVSCNTTDGNFLSETKFDSFSEEPYIVGIITNVSVKKIGPESYLSILVEENPKVHESFEKSGKK